MYNCKHTNTHKHNLLHKGCPCEKGGKKMGIVAIDTHEYKVDGILFDKDGTVIDFMLWIHWADAFIDLIDDKVDFPLDKKLLAKALGYSYNERQWDPKGPLAISSQQDIITILALCLYQQAIPWNQAYEIVMDALPLLEKSFSIDEHVKPVSGLIPFLKDAKDQAIKMGVVTSDNHENAIQHLDALGITEYFSIIVGHDQVNRGKPYPDMVYHACEQMHVHPANTIIFGDSNGDMTLGKNSGVSTSIGIIPSPDSCKGHLEDATHIISDYKGVKATKE